jgi:hypothetical protein
VLWRFSRVPSHAHPYACPALSPHSANDLLRLVLHRADLACGLDMVFDDRLGFIFYDFWCGFGGWGGVGGWKLGLPGLHLAACLAGRAASCQHPLFPDANSRLCFGACCWLSAAVRIAQCVQQQPLPV